MVRAPNAEAVLGEFHGQVLQGGFEIVRWIIFLFVEIDFHGVGFWILETVTTPMTEIAV